MQNITLLEIISIVNEKLYTFSSNSEKTRVEVFTKLSQIQKDLKVSATCGNEEARAFLKSRILFILSDLSSFINVDNIDSIISQYTINYYQGLYSQEDKKLNPLDEELYLYFNKFTIKRDDCYDVKLFKLAQICYQELFGFSIIDELVFDSIFNEVACNRYDYIWIQYKGIKRRIPNSNFKFQSQEQYIKIIENRVTSTALTDMNAGEPIIYAVLQNGSRVTAARPPLSRDYVVSIRKFDTNDKGEGFTWKRSTTKPFRYEKVSANEDRMFEILQLLIKRGRRNVAIIGEQGAGKTTAADNLVIKSLDESLSIGVAENIHELDLSRKYPNKNVIEFQYNGKFTPSQIIEMFFRFNRDIIVLGEVRNQDEAFEMIKVMLRQARGSVFTFHTSSVNRMIHDLRQLLLQSGNYKDFREAQFDIADAVDIVIHVMLDRETGGRYIFRISEIIACEADMSYRINDLFIFDKTKGEYKVNTRGLSDEGIESCLQYEMSVEDIKRLKMLFNSYEKSQEQ